MDSDVNSRLADALDRLPNGFPRTSSNVECRVLQKMFSAEEAGLLAGLTGDMETAAAIAERVGGETKDVGKRLIALVRRGMVWMNQQGGKPMFRLAPFVVGMFEAHLEDMDHEYAHLVDQYMLEGGAEGLMRPDPSIHRVVPAGKAVKREWVLPYDDIRQILLAMKSFNVHDCICRTQQEFVGRTCNHPLHNCLTFSAVERPTRLGDVTREEALAIVEDAAKRGLVHTVSNSQHINYVCNCCGCCCAMLRGVTEYGVENSVAQANYLARVNAEACTGCGLCVKRCQVDAVELRDEIAWINLDRCIGCGVCVAGCKFEAICLERKPEEFVVEPPVNFAEWEEQRAANRGAHSH